MSAAWPDRLEPWAPHPDAAPRCHREGERLVVEANGTRTCAGGWMAWYEGLEPGRRYRLEVVADHPGLALPHDRLRAMACTGDAPADTARAGTQAQLNLVPTPLSPTQTRFAVDWIAPGESPVLSLRLTLRWTASGTVRWSPATLTPLPAATGPASHRVAVVTGQQKDRSGPWTVDRNVDYYATRCAAACDDPARPELLLLPEIALQWGVPGSPLDTALPADGPEVGAFRELARARQVRIALGLNLRDGDAVFNSVLLLAPDGTIDGRYDKVHLAAGAEDHSGILPGDGFPVFGTELGRIGCNICMDSSAVESSRMVGLNGAAWLLLPIMGDHRADRWSPGPPVWSESRWLAIMRCHAMDNQLTLVVARNTCQGSCVIDRKGDLLAWNEGDRDHVVAEVPVEPGYLTWNGGCFRDVNWMQRRPHLYGAFTDPACRGSLT